MSRQVLKCLTLMFSFIMYLRKSASIILPTTMLEQVHLDFFWSISLPASVTRRKSSARKTAGGGESLAAARRVRRRYCRRTPWGWQWDVSRLYHPPVWEQRVAFQTLWILIPLWSRTRQSFPCKQSVRSEPPAPTDTQQSRSEATREDIRVVSVLATDSCGVFSWRLPPDPTTLTLR